MYVSLHFSPLSRGEATDLETIDVLVEQVLRADAAGVSAICLTEHHLGGFNTYCDPFLLASYLAGKLEQAYLAIHIVQVPLRHPVQMVEHCNILDVLTRGRCMIALAPGSPRQIELDAYGVSLEDRPERTRQKIDAMLRAWGWRDGDAPVDVSTDFDSGVVAGRVSPTSYRKPHPLIGRATMTPATIVDTAKLGLPAILALPDGEQATLYKDALESAGHSEATNADCLSWLGFLEFVCLAETEQAAHDRLGRFLEEGGVGPIVTAANEGDQLWIEEWKMRQSIWAQVGVPVTPELLAERMLGYKDLGVDHARVALATVPGDHARNMESFELFIEQVLPQLEPEPLPDPTHTVLSSPETAAASQT